MGYPGQMGGKALAQLLVGEVSPSGRLSQTFYREEYFQHVPMQDYSFPARADYPGRGYRFVEETRRFEEAPPFDEAPPFATTTGQDKWVLYPFGFGLSYDTFSYTWVEQKEKALEEERGGFWSRSCRFQVQVSSREGTGSSLLFFLRPPAEVAGVDGMLRKKLVHFERLPPARSQVVSVRLTPKERIRDDP
eukprot:g7846.t1